MWSSHRHYFSVNVGCGPAEERVLLTGLHAVSDIHCKSCKTTLGWKYVRKKKGEWSVGRGRGSPPLLACFALACVGLTTSSSRFPLSLFLFVLRFPRLASCERRHSLASITFVAPRRVIESRWLPRRRASSFRSHLSSLSFLRRNTLSNRVKSTRRESSSSNWLTCSRKTDGTSDRKQFYSGFSSRLRHSVFF